MVPARLSRSGDAVVVVPLVEQRAVPLFDLFGCDNGVCRSGADDLSGEHSWRAFATCRVVALTCVWSLRWARHERIASLD